MSVTPATPDPALVAPLADRWWLRAGHHVARRPTMMLLPLLALYAGVVLVVSRDTFQGDEGGYVQFAVNLSHGYYSPPGVVNLWWGPGYPMVLLPFVLLHLPWLAAKLLNALFLFGAVVYSYRTLALYVSRKNALFFAFLMGVYPPLMRESYMLLPEPLVIFLVSGFSFHFCKLHHDHGTSKFDLIAASGLMAYLALTKVFFGYVILAVIMVLVGQYVWKRQNVVRMSMTVFMLSMVMCVPYLVYTYSLTGKLFYWGTSGGMSLYWMSTPYATELGDWFSGSDVSRMPQLQKDHQAFFDEISGLNEVARDDRFKAEAMNNIAHHPAKFIRNWTANVGRLLFSYPFSYTEQKLSTFFFILPNMFIVVIAVLCVYASYLGRTLIPYEIATLLIVAVVAFGGSSLLSAYERQFAVLVPIVTLWFGVIFSRVVRIEIRKYSSLDGLKA